MGTREAEMEADVKRYENYIDDLQRKVNNVEGVAGALAAALKREKTSYYIAKTEEKGRGIRKHDTELMEEKYGQAVLELHLALSYLNDVKEVEHLAAQPVESIVLDRDVVREDLILDNDFQGSEYEEEEGDGYADMLDQIDEAYAENGKLYLQLRKLQRTLTVESTKLEQSVVDNHLMFSYANEPVAGSSMEVTVSVGETDLNLDARDCEWEMGVTEYQVRIDELVRGNQCVVAYYTKLVAAWKACVAENEMLKAGGSVNPVNRSIGSFDVDESEQRVVDKHLEMSYRNDYHAELEKDLIFGRIAEKEVVRLTRVDRAQRKREEVCCAKLLIVLGAVGFAGICWPGEFRLVLVLAYFKRRFGNHDKEIRAMYCGSTPCHVVCGLTRT
jgi:hypothetical protein